MKHQLDRPITLDQLAKIFGGFAEPASPDQREDPLTDEELQNTNGG